MRAAAVSTSGRFDRAAFGTSVHAAASGVWRSGYPHLVTLDVGHNLRWPIDVSNDAAAVPSDRLYAFSAPGSVDAGGRLTARGRETVLDGVRRTRAASRGASCIVWSPDECSHLLADGRVVDGRSPPKGEPVDSSDYENAPYHIVIVSYVPLPKGSAWSHLCARRLTQDLFELSSAAPIVLGHLDELPTTGPGSKLRRHLDADETVVRPAVFRGVRTTGIDGKAILGPIQPDGYSTAIVRAWPDQVFAACERIAERKLPADLLERVWRAIDPIRKGVIVGSVREAV